MSVSLSGQVGVLGVICLGIGGAEVLNLYSASLIEVNWWLTLIIIAFLLLILGHGFVNVFSRKKRFLSGDTYGAIFLISIPLLAGVFFYFNSGAFNNDLFAAPSTIYKGYVRIVNSIDGSETIEINAVVIKRYRFERNHLDSHCWTGKFSDLVEKYPNRIFEVKVVWHENGEYYKEGDRPEGANSCVLKVDVYLKNNNG
jgi:hypothetical protein